MSSMSELYKKLKLPDVSIIPSQYLSLKTEEEDDTAQEGRTSPAPPPSPKEPPRITRSSTIKMLFYSFVALLGLIAFTGAAVLENRQASSTKAVSSAAAPGPFQTSPELFAGPTATGRAPFLAETNPAPFGASRSFVPNTPLETALPIVGNTQNASIFQLMGQVSPYFPNPMYVSPSSPFSLDSLTL